MGRTLLFAGWAMALALLGWGFSQWERAQRYPAITATTHDGIQSVTIPRGRGGHFAAMVSINGTPIAALIDTGATRVAVPGHLAQQLGLVQGKPFRSQTAAGITVAYDTRIAELRLGDIVLYDVEASILPEYDAQEILLGMSVLSQFTLRIAGEQMTLSR